MKPHTCTEDDGSWGCTCIAFHAGPHDLCPIHEGLPWPPRCVICGRFMKREVKRMADPIGTSHTKNQKEQTMPNPKPQSSRAVENTRRRVSKVLAAVSFQVVSKPLEYEQLAALEAHTRLMQRILEEGK